MSNFLTNTDSHSHVFASKTLLYVATSNQPEIIIAQSSEPSQANLATNTSDVFVLDTLAILSLVTILCSLAGIFVWLHGQLNSLSKTMNSLNSNLNVMTERLNTSINTQEKHELEIDMFQRQLDERLDKLEEVSKLDHNMLYDIVNDHAYSQSAVIDLTNFLSKSLVQHFDGTTGTAGATRSFTPQSKISEQKLNDIKVFVETYNSIMNPMRTK